MTGARVTLAAMAAAAEAARTRPMDGFDMLAWEIISRREPTLLELPRPEFPAGVTVAFGDSVTVGARPRFAREAAERREAERRAARKRAQRAARRVERRNRK